MGMDLYSKKTPEGRKQRLYYRFNWSGWNNVCQFLEYLGCDISEFSGSNDGDVVSPNSCLSIANTVQNAFDAGLLLESYVVIRDGNYHILYVKKSIIRTITREYDGIPPSYEDEEIVVDYKNHRIIHEALKFPDSFNKIINNPKDAPLYAVINPPKFDILETVISNAFLKGKPFSQEMLINWDIKDYDHPWSSRLKYYIGFIEFCRECANLDGFTQN